MLLPQVGEIEGQRPKNQNDEIKQYEHFSDYDDDSGGGDWAFEG